MNSLLSHHLHNIRQKPDHIKRHIAFWTSLAITLVIVLFWFATMSLSDSVSRTVASKAESPLHAMTASAGDAWNSLRGAFGPSTATYKSPQLEVKGGN